MIEWNNDGIIDPSEIVLTLVIMNEEAEPTEEMEENDGNICRHSERH